MIKWSIKVFTWYSLSRPVGDFSQLVACPISRTCREEHKMYVPEMVLGLNSWTLMEPSWTLNAPDFRELECIFQLWTAHVGTQNWSIFLQIWGVDGFKTPRFLAICSPATIMMTMTTRPSDLVFSTTSPEIFTEICPGHRWAKWLWSETHQHFLHQICALSKAA